MKFDLEQNMILEFPLCHDIAEKKVNLCLNVHAKTLKKDIKISSEGIADWMKNGPDEECPNYPYELPNEINLFWRPDVVNSTPCCCIVLFYSGRAEPGDYVTAEVLWEKNMQVKKIVPKISGEEAVTSADFEVRITAEEKKLKKQLEEKTKELKEKDRELDEKDRELAKSKEMFENAQNNLSKEMKKVDELHGKNNELQNIVIQQADETFRTGGEYEQALKNAEIKLKEQGAELERLMEEKGVLEAEKKEFEDLKTWIDNFDKEKLNCVVRDTECNYANLNAQPEVAKNICSGMTAEGKINVKSLEEKLRDLNTRCETLLEDYRMLIGSVGEDVATFNEHIVEKKKNR